MGREIATGDGKRSGSGDGCEEKMVVQRRALMVNFLDQVLKKLLLLAIFLFYYYWNNLLFIGTTRRGVSSG